MTIESFLLIVAVVIAAIIAMLIIIYHLEKRDEKDLLSEGFLLYFNKQTKKFEQWPVLYFDKNVILGEDWSFVAKSFNSEIDDLNKFLEREKYHVSTGKQAIKAFDEYLESKLYD